MTKIFEGRCVKTMVLIKPNFLATQPLAREENPAFSISCEEKRGAPKSEELRTPCFKLLLMALAESLSVFKNA
jgi:hypothetical protein